MFVLAVKLKLVKGKEEEAVQFLRRVIAKVRQNEKDTLMYDLHRKVSDPTELFLYERYPDKQAWENVHWLAPYIEELRDELPNYLEGAPEVTEYETIELK